MARTQKNKATSFHLGKTAQNAVHYTWRLTLHAGQLKAKLAKLKRELLTPSSSGGGGGGKLTLISEAERSSHIINSGFRRCTHRRCQRRLYWISFSWKKHVDEQTDRAAFGSRSLRVHDPHHR